MFYAFLSYLASLFVSLYSTTLSPSLTDILLSKILLLIPLCILSYMCYVLHSLCLLLLFENLLFFIKLSSVVYNLCSLLGACTYVVLKGVFSFGFVLLSYIF